MKGLKMNETKLTEYIEKTKSYLKSARGRKNWFDNILRGYSFDQNMNAAVITACQLRKYENIRAVMVPLSINLTDAEWQFLKEG